MFTDWICSEILSGNGKFIAIFHLLCGSNLCTHHYRSSVSPACRKRRLNRAVPGITVQRMVQCRCLDRHVKEPYGMSMGLEARPWVQILLQSACTSMCYHIYNYNIIDCDVKQHIYYDQNCFNHLYSYQRTIIVYSLKGILFCALFKAFVASLSNFDYALSVD